MSLHKLQTDFKDLMLDHPDALKNPAQEFAKQFASGNIPLETRLSVYRNNIVGSLTDVMLTSFPLIEKLVGKEFLTQMARSFILQNPPNASCLNMFGQGFAEFIEHFEPARSLPYLPDMARLEIALNDSYYATEESVLTPTQLSAIPPESLENLKLRLCAHVKLLSSPFPLIGIRETCLDEDAAAPDMTQGETLMVVRPKDTVDIIPLSADEFETLTHLQYGLPLGAAVAKTLESHPSFDFPAFLQKNMTLETFYKL